MLGGIHLLTGISLSSLIPRDEPLTAFLIGVISHHALDSLPHIDNNWWYEKGKKVKTWPKETWFLVISEFLLILYLAILLLKGKPYLWKNAFWGGLGGLFPDLMLLLFQEIYQTKSKTINKYIHLQSNVLQSKADPRKLFLPNILLYLLILVINIAILNKK